MEDEENTFDSVQWTRSDEESSAATTPAKATGKQRQQSAASETDEDAATDALDPNADEADLAGIGASGYLDCMVNRPQKEGEGTKDAYVSYLSDFKTFSRSTFGVRRRFTDFVYLYKYLFRAYPHIAVPPLPDKHNISYVRGERFSADFINRRAFSLHRFTRRISLHPVLRRNATFLIFLESPDWNATMKGRIRSTSIPDGGAGSSAAGASSIYTSNSIPVGGSVNSSTSAFESFQDWSMNLFSRPHKPDKRFIEVKERCDKLDEDLSHVEKVATRVARREGDLETDFNELAAQFRKLVTMEPEVASELTSFASSVETTGTNLKTLRESTERDYLGSLRDMSAYVGSIKALLKVREQKQLDFEALTDYLAKSANDRDTLAGQTGSPSITSGPANFIRAKIEDVRGVDHESSRRNRLRSKELEIERLTREVEEAKKTSEAFDDQAVGECREFERIKSLEFRDTMGSLCDAQSQFFKDTIATFEEFIKGLEDEQKTKQEGSEAQAGARQEGVAA